MRPIVDYLKSILIFLPFILVHILLLEVQDLHAQLFPGLEGEVLADSIRSAYKPNQLLTFTQAKDTLYGKVFFENDSVRCIYSGLAHYLPSGVDPSQWVFGTGNETESINLEHGWPQAKGAGDGTDGQMNMYNLFPSRVAINSDRGDYPYSDINDNVTSKWYHLGQELTVKPSNNIDSYSEFVPGFFEPRESVKGDIARAMFYFWTIYRDDAVAADPNFFEAQKNSLCLWAQDDPVDNEESGRNDRIAHYQGGKINPFILDCSLVKRAYCPENMDCMEVAVSQPDKAKVGINFDVYQQRFQVVAEGFHLWNVNILNVFGQLLLSEKIESNQWSSQVYLLPGIYIAYGYNGNEKAITRFFIP